MAMVKCPECGAEVSNKAKKCPQCGSPLKKSKKKLIVILAVLAVILIIAIANSGGSESGSGANSSEQAAAPVEYLDCKAGDLLQEYKDNSARAKQNYEDKYLNVEGVVERIGDNATYFTINSGKNFEATSVKCTVRKEELKKQLVDINKGERVTVKGKCTDVSAGVFHYYEIEVEEIVK